MTESVDPTQPAAEPLLFRWLRRVSRTDWTIIASVVAAKVALFFFGVRAFRAIGDKEIPIGGTGWLEIWNRWDSLVYLKLAKDGYSADYVWKAWFYPLFPWSVRLAGRLCDDYLLGAFLVSGLASIAAALLLFRLVRLDFSFAVAQRSLFFFLIFPTAYYLHIGYTESLFIALAVGTILAARRDVWWAAGLLGALAWMTRPSGIVLLPTLAVEIGHRFYPTRRWNWRWLWLGLIPLGFCVYLLLNWKVTGDPFAFFKMHAQVNAHTFAAPWVGIRESIGNMRRNPNQSEIVGVQEVFFTVLGLFCAVVSWFRLRPSYAAWITFSWLLYTCDKFLESEPRYALTMFPIFILFALVARNRVWNLVLTMWSLLTMAIFASLFIRGWWAF